jgi:hypothetical protein
MDKSFKDEIDSLRKYFKEESIKVVNPRFKKEIFEETKYAFLEENELVQFKKDPYILGHAKVRLTILNKPTQNLTYYDADWADKAILKNEKFQNRLGKKRVTGELGHPKDPDGSPKDISHAVIKVWLEGEELWGIVEVFNTIPGQALWILLNAGVILGISSRGLGDDYFENGVKKVRGENFEMIGWDFVNNESNIGCEFLEFSENKIRDIIPKLEKLNRNSFVKSILESFTEEKKMKEENIKLQNTIAQLEEKFKLEAKKYDILENENKELKIQLESKNTELQKVNDVMKVQTESVKSYEKTITEERLEKKALMEKVDLQAKELVNKDTMLSKLKVEMEEIKRDGVKNTVTYNVQLESVDREADKKEKNIFSGRVPKY